MIEKLKAALAALEDPNEVGYLREQALDALRSVIAEMEAERPVAYVAYSPTNGNGLRLFFDKKDARRYADDLSPLYTHPQPKAALPKCMKCGDQLMSSFASTCYACNQKTKGK